MGIEDNERALIEQALADEVGAVVDRLVVVVVFAAMAAFSSALVVAAAFSPFALSGVRKHWGRVVDKVKESARRMFRGDEDDALLPVLNMVDDMELPARIHERVVNTLQAGVDGSWSREELFRKIKDSVGNPVKTTAGIVTAVATALYSIVQYKRFQREQVKFKRWVSNHDDRTRPDHLAADGQVQLKDDPFQVGGSLLDAPGDPSGPASQVANCRCVMVGVNRDGDPVTVSQNSSGLGLILHFD